jgi:lysophospholipase L1-like esterase
MGRYPALQPVVKAWRRIETGEAPRREGATTENTGSIRARSNAAGPGSPTRQPRWGGGGDASPVECSQTFTTGRFVRPSFSPVSRILLAAAGSALIAGCGSTPPVAPTPPSNPPALACPAAVTTPSIDGRPIAVTYPDPTITGGQSPFTLTCAPVSGASYAVGTTPVTCTVTDAQRRTATCSFPITVVIPPTPRIGLTNFVAFGDSITRGEDGRNTNLQGESQTERFRPLIFFPDPQTYPGVLLGELDARYTAQAISVVNSGNPGESVSALGTFPRFRTTTAGAGAVLLLEGANDLTEALRDSTVETAAINGLRRMVEDAKSRGVRVYLATLTPMNPAGSRGGAWNLVPGFNTQVSALAAAEGVALVDLYQALFPDIGTYIGFDGLHPTAAGYAKIADTFFAVIKQTLETSAPASRGTAAPGRAVGGRIPVRSAAPSSPARTSRPAPARVG